MNPLNIKTTFCVGVACLAVAPKIGYVASDKYIKSYNSTSSYITETTERMLNKIGLQTLSNPEDLDSVILQEAKRYNTHPELLRALIRHESLENPDALSLKGAIGYAQIMPANAKRCGLSRVSELWDMQKNVRCGAQILSEELQVYDGDLEKALFSYNGGPSCVKHRCSESINHANKVRAIFAQNTYQK